MNQIIKNELRELYTSFDMTNNFYEKEYMVSFFDYLKAVFNDDKEIIEMSDDINKKMMNLRRDSIFFLIARKRKIDEYVENNQDFFYENIIAPDSFEKIMSDCIFPLRDDNITYILEEFFKNMGKGIYDYYKKINDEGRVFLGISNETAYTSLNNSNTIIFVKSLEDLLDMMVLIHEIGHAYYFYLNNTKIRERNNIENEIKEEIPAKIMEIKFINFLKDNALYEQSIVLKNLFDYVFYEYGRSENKFDALKYTIASDIAETSGNDVDIDNYFKHIYSTDIYKLVLENTNNKAKGKRFYK